MTDDICRQEKSDPELSLCRTTSVGSLMPGSGMELFYCSIEKDDCRYALPVGYDYLCKHGNSHSFPRGESPHARP